MIRAIFESTRASGSPNANTRRARSEYDQTRQGYSNSSNTESGLTIVTCYGMFAHIDNPFNSYRSCYVLSGTHPYATIGIAQCIAPIRGTHYDGAKHYYELVKQQFGQNGYFHAITQAKAANGDIRQPEVHKFDFFTSITNICVDISQLLPRMAWRRTDSACKSLLRFDIRLIGFERYRSRSGEGARGSEI